MFDRFTDDARKAVALSRKEAQRLQHDFIGTQHVAVGLLDLPSGPVVEILRCLKVSVGSAREAILRDVLPGPAFVTMNHLPFIPSVKKALEGSMAAAIELGHSYIGSGHLLLGLLTVGDDTSKRLIGCGLEIEKVKSELKRVWEESLKAQAESASTIFASELNASIESALRRSQEIRDDAGRERARLDFSVTGRPRIVLLDTNGRPGPSLWLDAAPDGSLRILEARAPNPLRVEISVGPDGKLRIGHLYSPAPPTQP